MAKTNTNANLGVEKELWAVANKLRASGGISAADYRKVVVGLIFLKYVSDTFEWKYDELVAEGDGFEEEKDAYTMDNVFFVPKDARWSHIASNAHTPEISQVIDDAMRAIEKENKSFKGVLPMNYANSDIDKQTLGEVVDMFTNNINLRDHNEEKDLLGRTYEYFIEQFAAAEGQKGGEFYTPTSIVKTIVAVLKPFKGRVYDSKTITMIQIQSADKRLQLGVL